MPVRPSELVEKPISDLTRDDIVRLQLMAKQGREGVAFWMTKYNRFFGILNEYDPDLCMDILIKSQASELAEVPA